MAARARPTSPARAAQGQALVQLDRQTIRMRHLGQVAAPIQWVRTSRAPVTRRASPCLSRAMRSKKGRGLPKGTPTIGLEAIYRESPHVSWRGPCRHQLTLTHARRSQWTWRGLDILHPQRFCETVDEDIGTAIIGWDGDRRGATG